MRRNITFKKSAFMGLGCYLVGFFGLFLFVGAVEEVYGVGNNLANETAAILGHRLNSEVGAAGDFRTYKCLDIVFFAGDKLRLASFAVALGADRINFQWLGIIPVIVLRGSSAAISTGSMGLFEIRESPIIDRFGDFPGGE